MIPIEDLIWFQTRQIDIIEARNAFDVAAGKITQEASDSEIAHTRAVLRILEWCERNKPLIHELRKAERRAA